MVWALLFIQIVTYSPVLEKKAMITVVFGATGAVGHKVFNKLTLLGGLKIFTPVLSKCALFFFHNNWNHQCLLYILQVQISLFFCHCFIDNLIFKAFRKISS